MSDSAENALAYSNRLGRWSFFHQMTGPIQPNTAISLVTVQGLDAWFGRQWTVHLNHYKFSSAGGVALNPNTPTDNQVFTEGALRVRFDFGVDGGEDTAFVDWPAQGATFQLHAGGIRMAIVQPLGFTMAAPFPLLTGFIAPAGASDRSPTMSPCLTEGPFNLGALAARSNPRPPRAVAYRIWSTATGGPLSLNESSQTIANIVKFDGVFPVAVPGDAMYQANNQAAWIPLHPVAQFVNVTNQSATVATDYTINWLLDLG